jgi:hypothetical protein
MPRKRLRSLTKTGCWKRFIARLSPPGAEYLQLKLAEGRHFRRAKNALGWIQQNTILAEALQQCAQVLLVLLRGRGD